MMRRFLGFASSGEVQISQHDWDHETRRYRRVTIDHADPRVLISAELLEQAQAGHLRYCSLDGDLLTISADNGRWIYRLGEWDGPRHARWMEWPD